MKGSLAQIMKFTDVSQTSGLESGTTVTGTFSISNSDVDLSGSIDLDTAGNATWSFNNNKGSGTWTVLPSGYILFLGSLNTRESPQLTNSIYYGTLSVSVIQSNKAIADNGILFFQVINNEVIGLAVSFVEGTFSNDFAITAIKLINKIRPDSLVSFDSAKKLTKSTLEFLDQDTQWWSKRTQLEVAENVGDASLFLDNLGKTLENIFKAALTFDGKKFK